MEVDVPENAIETSITFYHSYPDVHLFLEWDKSKTIILDLNNSINGQIYIDSGSLYPSPNASQSEFIEVKDAISVEIKYPIAGTYRIVYKYYTGAIKGYTIVTSESNKLITSKIPSGAYAISLSYYTNYPIKTFDFIFEDESQINKTVMEYDRLKYKEKTLACLGDSITYGYDSSTSQRMNRPLPTVVQDLLGLKVSKNYGVNGSTLSVCEGASNFITKLDTMGDADIVWCFGGTNDWGIGTSALGSMSNTSSDTSTIYGSIMYLCENLINKYYSSTIFFITPLRRENCNQNNSSGYNLEDVANAIKEVCSSYGIPVLDLYNTGCFYVNNSDFKNKYAIDGLHPNQNYVDNFLSHRAAGFIKELIG